jgi:hypothetical protein
VAKTEFIANIRTAARLISPRVRADSPVDADQLQRGLERAALWLTPRAVDGFHIRDFGELPLDQQHCLERSVQAFKQVAEQVSPTGPASHDQVDKALHALSEILHVLAAYVSMDDESFRVARIIEDTHFPEYVRGFDWKLDEDSAGDEALWVWVVVDDAVASFPSFSAKAQEVQRLIASGLRDAGISRWPYVRFRAMSEVPYFYE